MVNINCEALSLVNVIVDGRSINLTVWDTAGGEDYDRFRPLAYQHMNVLIICFSLTNTASFENVRNRWYPEVQKHCDNVPIILVGNKLDLTGEKKTINRSNDAGLASVTYKQVHFWKICWILQ